MEILLWAVLIVLSVWSLYGYFGSRVEQAKYSVLKKEKGYEIRNYPRHIVAQTRVVGPYDESMRKGFTAVAGYIFGANTKKEKIAMTTPVLMEKGVSEKIAMTAPVLMSGEDGARVISFGMPESYTMDTLPIPLNTEVVLMEIPDKKFAVLRFSGHRTSARIQAKEKKLLELLSRDGVTSISQPSYAGYNAPGTPPWMTRHEVLVEIA